MDNTTNITAKFMTDYELKNIDSEEIEDWLVKVETSFDITFADSELSHVTTFGELCDHITNKIQLNKVDDCTSQQAFHKLRHAISLTLEVDNNAILPNQQLANLFPRQNRREKIEQIEQNLGFRLNILRLPYWMTAILFILFLVSLVGLCFYWQIGLLGLVVSISGLFFATKIGNEFDLQTVGQVAQKMTRENYLKSRRNQKTFNKREIEKVLTDWFSEDFNLNKIKFLNP